MDMSVSELKQNRDLCRDLLKLKELPNSIISKEVNLIREKWAQIMVSFKYYIKILNDLNDILFLIFRIKINHQKKLNWILRRRQKLLSLNLLIFK